MMPTLVWNVTDWDTKAYSAWKQNKITVGWSWCVKTHKLHRRM